MKKTETKISAVRGIQDPSKSIVKIKRHSFTQRPHSARKVVFNIPSAIGSESVPLPIHIPEEHLKELENESRSISNSDSQKDRSLKRVHEAVRRPQPVKSSSKSSGERPISADSSPAFVFKLAAEIQAIEEKLSKVETALTKNVDEKLTSVEKMLSQAVDQPSQKKSKNQTPITEQRTNKRLISESAFNEPYNVSDYVDDSPSAGFSQDYVVGTYISELHSQVVMPLKSQSSLSCQYPVDYDPKSAINAIRNELAEWRKTHKFSSPNPSFYGKKTDASSSDAFTSKSEGECGSLENV